MRGNFGFGQCGSAGRIPQYAFRRESASSGSGKQRQMIAQADKAGIKGLSVKGQPTMDMGIHSIEDGRAGKILDTKHKGRQTGISYQHGIRFALTATYAVFPGKKLARSDFGTDNMPVAQGLRIEPPGAADPKQCLHSSFVETSFRKGHMKAS